MENDKNIDANSLREYNINPNAQQLIKFKSFFFNLVITDVRQEGFP